MDTAMLMGLVFTCMVEMSLCLLLCDTILQRKYQSKALYPSVFALMAVLIFVVNLASNTYLNMVVGIVLVTLVAQLFYRGNFFLCLTTALVQLFVAITAEGMTAALSVLLLEASFNSYSLVDNGNSYWLLGQMISCKMFHIIVQLALITFLRGRRNRRYSQRCTSSNLVIFFAYPIINTFIIPLLLQCGPLLEASQRFLLLVALGVSCALSLVNYMLFQNSLDATELSHELALARQQAEIQAQYYEGLQSSYYEARALVHDFKSHLSAIAAMQDTGDSGLPGYTSELCQHLELSSGVVALEVRNDMFNIVLTEKRRSCQQRGIELCLSCMVDDLSFLSSADTCIILANGLDNAIEACDGLPVPQTITMQLYRHNSTLVITLANPVSRPVQQVDNHLVTTKADRTLHGFGLENIRRAVERYQGTMSTQYDDGQFCLILSFPLPTEQ